MDHLKGVLFERSFALFSPLAIVFNYKAGSYLRMSLAASKMFFSES